MTTKPLLEKDIEKRVCKYAESKGLLQYKFTSPNRSSVPDRLFFTKKGTPFFIEFKRPGKTLTVAQKREAERLIARSINVFIVDDVEVGKLLIDSMENQ